jgi:Asp-tRNA(Asn)/Glu-tRNA(Gln) amidotransferase A subunit family amidase
VFAKAVRTPSVTGWCIAWTVDLGGLVLVDREVRTAFEHAIEVFRRAGARMEAVCPDMTHIPRSCG